MRAELGLQGFQTVGASDAQTVEVSVEAVVECAEVVQVVMRRAQGVVAQKGEEAGFFGVLFKDD